MGHATVGRGTARSSPGGQAWVSLAGFSRETIAGQREIGGLVVVGLPLDRFARVARAIGRDVEPVIGSRSRTPSRTWCSPRSPRSRRSASHRGSRARPSRPRGGRPGSATTTLVSMPSSLALAGAACCPRRACARSATTPRRSMRSRASTRIACATPPARTSASRHGSRGASIACCTRRTSPRSSACASSDTTRARASPGRVLEALFHWHRAWLELRWAQAASRDAREPPNRPSRDETESALRVMEAEATLDVLTAGWFTASRARFAVTRADRPGAELVAGGAVSERCDRARGGGARLAGREMVKRYIVRNHANLHDRATMKRFTIRDPESGHARTPEARLERSRGALSVRTRRRGLRRSRAA